MNLSPISHTRLHAPRTKAEFYQRYHAGEFGNRPRSWPDFAALQADANWQGQLISARSSTVSNGPIYLSQTLDAIRQANGGTLDGLTFVEPIPHHRNLIQGEICRTEGPLELTYSTRLNVPQRDCRGPHGKHASGVVASVMLRHFMYPSDFDHLMELVERFPDAAIEFSVFDCFVGVLPMSNTLIWEVREY